MPGEGGPVIVLIEQGAAGIVELDLGVAQDFGNTRAGERGSEGADEDMLLGISGDDETADQDVIPVAHLNAGRDIEESIGRGA